MVKYSRKKIGNRQTLNYNTRKRMNGGSYHNRSRPGYEMDHRSSSRSGIHPYNRHSRSGRHPTLGDISHIDTSIKTLLCNTNHHKESLSVFKNALEKIEFFIKSSKDEPTKTKLKTELLGMLKTYPMNISSFDKGNTVIEKTVECRKESINAFIKLLDNLK